MNPIPSTQNNVNKPNELKLLRSAEPKVLLQELFDEQGDFDSNKERIKKFVKRFLVYEVPKYNNRITSLQDKASRGSDKNLYSFVSLTDRLIKQCHELENQLDNRLLRKQIQRSFRDLINPWYGVNTFMQRCLEKPRGYPGDYATMEMVYDYKPRPFEKYGFFDHYLLGHASCVRSRKEKLKSYLKTFLASQAKLSPDLTILSLGSGPCREWFELGQRISLQVIPRIHLVCLDHDVQALEFSQGRLSKNQLLEEMKCINESLVTYSNNEWSLEIKLFDLIYAVGSADYFYDESLRRILSRSLTLLKPGGVLLVTHKDSTKFDVAPSEWLCDWSFVARDEERFSHLVQGVLLNSGLVFSWHIERDEIGQMMFGVAKKSKGAA